MSQVGRNILANFAGSGWAALLNVIVVPLYLRLMGIEAYGLIGFFSAMQAVLSLLDMGVSPTLNREMARYTNLREHGQQARDLVRTLEALCWTIALCIAVAVVAAAPLIAGHWIKADRLPLETIQQAIVIMGLVAACQWPIGFYTGGLQGLQQQVLLNGINMVSATLRYGGAVLVLWITVPTVTVFFMWQIFVSSLQTGLLTFFLWRRLPPGQHTPHLRPSLVKGVWRFAIGMSAIAATVALLMQMDKVVLSRLVPLDQLGYYTLAWTIAGGITLLTRPIFNAMFPHLSSLAAGGATSELASQYHSGSRIVAITILPAAAVLAFFSREVLLLWTSDAAVGARAHMALSLLLGGTALNSIMNMPYSLQLAHGWTKLTFYTNLISIVLLAPLVTILTKLYGLPGASAVWLLLNMGYVLVQVQIMHRRLLPEEKWRWYVEDVGKPLVCAVLIAGVGRWLSPDNVSPPTTLLYMLAIWLLSVLAVLLVTREFRCRLARYLRASLLAAWSS